MDSRSVCYHCILTLCFLQGCLILSIGHESFSDVKVLRVGQELEMESLPLQMGRCLYQLNGLKDSVWYEIKISYPASIPSSFSIQLTRDASGLWLGKDRRLLNTEKLIFKASFNESDSGRLEHLILVTVEAAGVVAKPGAHDREVVLFNIVCDELSLGIPHKAWWVGIAAALCLGLAFIIPCFLSSEFLVTNQHQQSSNLFMIKDS